MPKCTYEAHDMTIIALYPSATQQLPRFSVSKPRARRLKAGVCSEKRSKFKTGIRCNRIHRLDLFASALYTLDLLSACLNWTALSPFSFRPSRPSWIGQMYIYNILYSIHCIHCVIVYSSVYYTLYSIHSAIPKVRLGNSRPMVFF